MSDEVQSATASAFTYDFEVAPDGRVVTITAHGLLTGEAVDIQVWDGAAYDDLYELVSGSYTQQTLGYPGTDGAAVGRKFDAPGKYRLNKGSTTGTVSLRRANGSVW